jgi:WD40 repeat protein
MADDEGDGGAGGAGGGARLSLQHAFGVSGPVRNNCAYVTDSVLAHPVGQHVALFDVEAREMQFMQKARSTRAVLAMELGPKRNYIAVCEAAAVEGQAQVSVFHAGTRNRMRTMTFPTQGGQFCCAAFSADSKQLVTMTDGPDFAMVQWKWEQEKVLASAAVGHAVTRVRCGSKEAPKLITASGPMHLRAWTAGGDSKLSAAPLLSSGKEQENWVDHCWLPSGDVVAVTEHGLLAIFELSDGGGGGGGGAPALVPKVELSCRMPLADTRVETLCPYAKGFLAGGSMGFVEAWEAGDDAREPYAWVKTLTCGEDQTVQTLSVSPNEETAALYTRGGRLLTFPLGSIDVLEEHAPPAANFTELAENGTHVGAVVAMDACRQKPLIFTVGADRTARAWNYFRWRCEVCTQLTEDPTSIAAHPTGFQVVIAFKERVRLYNVLLGALRPFKEMPVKNCRELQFSNGGHVFACVSGISVHVYSTHTFEQLHIFNGHIAPVTRLTWSRDDHYLYSAGADGGVYGWHLDSNSRLDDTQHITKQCAYAGLVVDNPEKGFDPTGPFAACGNDCKLRMIKSGEEVLALETGEQLTALQLSNNNKILFAGTRRGAIRAYAWPLTPGPAEYTEVACHHGAVTRLRISHDDAYLFSSSADGTLFTMLVVPKLPDGREAHAAPPDRRAFNVDAVLVSKEEMDEQAASLADLRAKLEQMKADTEYNLHRKDTEWGERLKGAKTETESALRAEHSRYEELQMRHEQYVRDHMEELDKRGAGHVRVTQELENQYEHKLATELARYDALAEEMEALRQRCEGLLEAQDARHARLAAEERHAAEQHTLTQTERIRQLHEDLKYNEVKFEEVLAQQEAEYERELQQLKGKAEGMLAEERQNTALKQGGLSAMKNKYEGLKKKKEEAEDKLRQTVHLFNKERERADKLATTLRHYELHLEQRESALEEKERTVLSLRSTNRTLDNFRFVLDHRLQQLAEEKGPLTQHIAGLEEHIRKMYDELVAEYQGKKSTASVIEQKDLKMGTLQRELNSLRAQFRERERTIAAFGRDLTAVVGLTVPKELEDATKDLYRQYVKGERPMARAPKGGAGGEGGKGGKGGGKPKGGDGDDDDDDDSDAEGGGGGGGGGDGGEAAREARRQRDYMQKTVATLKKTLKQTKTEAAAHNRTAMSENSLLIR